MSSPRPMQPTAPLAIHSAIHGSQVTVGGERFADHDQRVVDEEDDAERDGQGDDERAAAREIPSGMPTSMKMKHVAEPALRQWNSDCASIQCWNIVELAPGPRRSGAAPPRPRSRRHPRPGTRSRRRRRPRRPPAAARRPPAARPLRPEVPSPPPTRASSTATRARWRGSVPPSAGRVPPALHPRPCSSWISSLSFWRYAAWSASKLFASSDRFRALSCAAWSARACASSLSRAERASSRFSFFSPRIFARAAYFSSASSNALLALKNSVRGCSVAAPSSRWVSAAVFAPSRMRFSSAPSGRNFGFSEGAAAAALRREMNGDPPELSDRLPLGRP